MTFDDQRSMTPDESRDETQVGADIAAARRYLGMAAALLNVKTVSEVAKALGQVQMTAGEFGQLAAQVGAGYVGLAMLEHQLAQSVPVELAVTSTFGEPFARRALQAVEEARPHDEPRDWSPVLDSFVRNTATGLRGFVRRIWETEVLVEIFDGGEPGEGVWPIRDVKWAPVPKDDDRPPGKRWVSDREYEIGNEPGMDGHRLTVESGLSGRRGECSCGEWTHVAHQAGPETVTRLWDAEHLTSLQLETTDERAETSR